MRQRIKPLAPPIVDQVQRRRPLLILDLVARENLAGVDDCRRQTRFHQLMQKRAVQNHPRSRHKPKTDVAQSYNGVAVG